MTDPTPPEPTPSCPWCAGDIDGPGDLCDAHQAWVDARVRAIPDVILATVARQQAAGTVPAADTAAAD